MTLHDAIVRFWRYDLTDDFDKDVVRALRAIVERLEPTGEQGDLCSAGPCADWLAECELQWDAVVLNQDLAHWARANGPHLMAIAKASAQHHFEEKRLANLLLSIPSEANIGGIEGSAEDWRDYIVGALIAYQKERDDARAKLAACEQGLAAANAKAERLSRALGQIVAAVLGYADGVAQDAGMSECGIPLD